jgi:hypothetical protein
MKYIVTEKGRSHEYQQSRIDMISAATIDRRISTALREKAVDLLNQLEDIGMIKQDTDFEFESVVQAIINNLNNLTKDEKDEHIEQITGETTKRN